MAKMTKMSRCKGYKGDQTKVKKKKKDTTQGSGPAEPKPKFESEKRQQNLEVNVLDVLIYLEKIKRAFRFKRHVVKDFINIMGGYRSGRLPTKEVVEKVTTLFTSHGRPELLVGFNAFLPPENQIKFHQKTGRTRESLLDDIEADYSGSCSNTWWICDPQIILVSVVSLILIYAFQGMYEYFLS